MPSLFLFSLAFIIIKYSNFGHNKKTVYIGGQYYAEVARYSWATFIGN